MVAHSQEFKRALGPDSVSRRNHAAQKLSNAWNNFRQLWRCDWSLSDWSQPDIIVVVVAEVVDRDIYLKKVAQAYNQTFLRTICQKVEEGKWGKFCPPIDFVAGNMACCNMLSRLLFRAGEKMTTTITTLTEPRELIWQETASIRLSDSKTLVADHDKCFTIVESVIILEQVRDLTFFS